MTQKFCGRVSHTKGYEHDRCEGIHFEITSGIRNSSRQILKHFLKIIITPRIFVFYMCGLWEYPLFYVHRNVSKGTNFRKAQNP